MPDLTDDEALAVKQLLEWSRTVRALCASEDARPSWVTYRLMKRWAAAFSRLVLTDENASEADIGYRALAGRIDALQDRVYQLERRGK